MQTYCPLPRRQPLGQNPQRKNVAPGGWIVINPAFWEETRPDGANHDA